MTQPSPVNRVGALFALAAVVVLGACSFDDDAASQESPGSSPATPPPGALALPTVASLTVEELESAPVPSACGHPAGTLVYGELPLVPDGTGGVWLSRDEEGLPRHLETTLAGTGPELLVLLDCSQGGVAWPQVVVLYGHGPTVLGWLDLGAVQLPGPSGESPYGYEHVVIEDWHPLGAEVRAALVSYQGAGSEVMRWSGSIRMLNEELVLDQVTAVAGPESPLQ